MSFLAPTLLFGALAAAIPIALHFFYRSRYRTVPWAAMRFLLTSIEQTSRRLRFQELLLLVLRVCLLLLLAVALARPAFTSSRGGSRGDAVDAVLVLDTSYSMAARESDTTRWELARKAALDVIDQLPAYSTAQVIECSDRAAFLGPAASSNLDQARHVIRGIERTHLATDLLPGVREARAALERGHSPNKEVYLFSDMQRLGWDEQSSVLRSEFQEISQRATVTLVRCGTRTPRNAAIVGLAPQWGMPRTGERTSFSVLVRNTGSEPLRDLSVALAVNGRADDGDARPLLDDRGKQVLAPGETRPFSVAARLDRAGRNVLTATLRSDDLDADNRFDQILNAHERVQALIVDGSPNLREPEKSASFHVAWGLKPIPAEIVAAASATPRHLANKDFCVLSNVALEPRPGAGTLQAGFLDALAAFVRDGGSLLIFGGTNVTPDVYNRLLFEQLRLLPVRLAGFHDAPPSGPLTLNRKTADVSPFTRFRDDSAYQGLDKVEVRRVLKLEEAPATAKGEETPDDEVRVLMRWSNGWPALVRRKQPGRGEVVLVATSVQGLEWTDWPIDVSFVPFLQAVIADFLDGQTPQHNRRAGEPLQWHPASPEAVSRHLLVRPDGSRLPLGVPDTVRGQPLLIAADTPLAGLYRFVVDRGGPAGREEEGIKDLPGALFAVVPDLRESEDLTALTDADLDDRLGFRPVHLTAGTDGSLASGTERLSREWTAWLLLAMFGLVVCESLLAWLCGRAW